MLVNGAARKHRDANHIARLFAADEAEVSLGSKLSDEEELVRIQAITALGFMGGPDDLVALDQIAATDPYYYAEVSFYPFRVNARYAAKALRSRLADHRNARQ
jgi:HEAT repeat protein